MEFIKPEISYSVKRPKKLYMYFGSMEKLILVLKNKGIYLSNVCNFNDPFDEIYSVSNIGSNTYKTWVTFQEICEAYLTCQKYLENYENFINFREVKLKLCKNEFEWIIKIEDAVEAFIQASGFDKIPKKVIIEKILENRNRIRTNLQDELIKVRCFSEKVDSIPMWAYYANNHRGCCVRFDTSLLNKEISENIFPIQYKNERSNELMHYVKSKEWEHEKEWRIILRGFVQEYLPFDCVTGIYFGIKNDFSDTPNIVKAWPQKEDYLEKHYSNYLKIISLVNSSNNKIALFRGKESLSKYKIEFEKFYLN